MQPYSNHPFLHFSDCRCDNVFIYIHTENPQKVYLEKVSYLYYIYDSYHRFNIYQRCPENDFDNAYYGTISGNSIEFPIGAFAVDDVSYNTSAVPTLTEPSSSARYSTSVHKIVFPTGVLGSIPVKPVEPVNPDEPIVDASGIFLGLTAFNQEIKSKAIGALTNENKDEYCDFVNSLETKIGTLLYYGTDLAIETMTAPVYPTNLGNAVLITFTDGLDQGSLAYKPDYRNSATYAAHLSELIAKTEIQGCPLQAFSIGLKGQDVADDELFMSNLESLASKESNALTVSDIASVNKELSRIVDELASTSVKKVITISLPMPSDGEKIRLTLDKAQTDITTSETWIEGTFSIDNMALTDVSYTGFRCASGGTVTSVRNGIFLDFTFTDCRDLEKDAPLSTEKEDIDHWYYIPSKDLWQHNVEINNDEQVKIEEIHTSTVVMFALDCSSSLGDKFASLQQAANSFIEKLATGKNDENSGIDNIFIDNDSDNQEATPEYYNLQGIRIINPSHGLYIRRVGNKTDKIIL